MSRADRSRAQLIDAALTCFSRDGLEGTSIRDIAELAGQNTASISYHFGSKENLYHSVLAETMRLIRAVGEEVVSEIGRLEDTQSMTPAAAINLLQRFFATVFRALIEDDNGIRIAPLIVREQIRPTPTFDLIYEEGIHQNHKMLSRLVRDSHKRPGGGSKNHSARPQSAGAIQGADHGQGDDFASARVEGFQGGNADEAISVIEENIEALLNALREREEGKARGVQMKWPSHYCCPRRCGDRWVGLVILEVPTLKRRGGHDLSRER